MQMHCHMNTALFIFYYFYIRIRIISTLISTVVRPRSARRSAAVRDQLAARPLTDQVGPARPRSHGTNRPAPRVRCRQK